MPSFRIDKNETSVNSVKTIVWIAICTVIVVIGIVVAIGYGPALVRKMDEEGIINETIPIPRLPPFLTTMV